MQQVVDWIGEYAALLNPSSDLPGSVTEYSHPEQMYP